MCPSIRARAFFFPRRCSSGYTASMRRMLVGTCSWPGNWRYSFLTAPYVTVMPVLACARLCSTQRMLTGEFLRLNASISHNRIILKRGSALLSAGLKARDLALSALVWAYVPPCVNTHTSSAACSPFSMALGRTMGAFALPW
jgi:hypothetical protein